MLEISFEGLFFRLERKVFEEKLSLLVCHGLLFRLPFGKQVCAAEGLITEIVSSLGGPLSSPWILEGNKAVALADALFSDDDEPFDFSELFEVLAK